jgi:hypothetical protein
MFNSGSAEDLSEGDCRLHFAGQVRIVELVRVAEEFIGLQFQIRSAEGVALTGGEIGERHFVTTADFGIEVMNLARESVWWKPLGHRVCIQKRAINSLGRRPEHSVKLNGVCCHILSGFVSIIPTNDVIDSGH